MALTHALWLRVPHSHTATLQPSPAAPLPLLPFLLPPEPRRHVGGPIVEAVEEPLQGL